MINIPEQSEQENRIHEIILDGIADSTEILDQVISQNETVGFYNQIKIS